MNQRSALLLAGAAHLALLTALSVAFVKPPQALPTFTETTPVEVVDIGPTPTVTETPKESIEAAPQETEETVAPPAPAEPEPAPAPTPEVSDAPAQDAIAPEPAPQKPAKPQPAPPKPEPAPSKPKPVPPAPKTDPAPPQPKPSPPAKATASAKPADLSSLANLIDKALPKAPQRTQKTSDFAKSIEAAIPKGARLDARAMATLQQAIRSQIAPCWNPPLGGADVASMTAVLRIRLNKDGTVAAAPELVSQTAANAENAAYSRAFVETAKRAVLRCAPIKLPADLYPYWQQFELNFDPREMT